jgi:endonuclease YncB( thermonuclease family)
VTFAERVIIVGRMIPARLPLLLLLLAGLFAALPIPGLADDDPIWTTQPTHIDRAKQNFERLPAKVVPRDSRTWLVVPDRIKVLNSVTFSFGDRIYRIAHLRPIEPKRVCQAVEGGRWPCGRMASIFLGNLVRGKRLLCEQSEGKDLILLHRCVIGSRDIAASIIREGLGKSDGDQALLVPEGEAQAEARKGLWRNPLCRTDFDSC